MVFEISRLSAEGWCAAPITLVGIRALIVDKDIIAS